MLRPFLIYADMLMEHRQDINEYADVTILTIADEEYSLEPKRKINTIMIIVAFAILLLLIIIWIGLYYWK